MVWIGGTPPIIQQKKKKILVWGTGTTFLLATQNIVSRARRLVKFFFTGRLACETTQNIGRHRPHGQCPPSSYTMQILYLYMCFWLVGPINFEEGSVYLVALY